MHEMRKFPFEDRSNVAPQVKDWRHQEKIYLRGRIGSVVRTDATVTSAPGRTTDAVHLAINCRRAGRWLPAVPRPATGRSFPNDDATEADLGLLANGTYCAICDSARHHFVVSRLAMAKCPDASGRWVLQETAVSNACLDRGAAKNPPPFLLYHVRLS